MKKNIIKNSGIFQTDVKLEDLYNELFDNLDHITDFIGKDTIAEKSKYSKKALKQLIEKIDGSDEISDEIGTILSICDNMNLPDFLPEKLMIFRKKIGLLSNSILHYACLDRSIIGIKDNSKKLKFPVKDLNELYKTKVYTSSLFGFSSQYECQYEIISNNFVNYKFLELSDIELLTDTIRREKFGPLREWDNKNHVNFNQSLYNTMEHKTKKSENNNSGTFQMSGKLEDRYKKLFDNLDFMIDFMGKNSIEESQDRLRNDISVLKKKFDCNIILHEIIYILKAYENMNLPDFLPDKLMLFREKIGLLSYSILHYVHADNEEILEKNSSKEINFSKKYDRNYSKIISLLSGLALFAYDHNDQHIIISKYFKEYKFNKIIKLELLASDFISQENFALFKKWIKKNFSE